MFPASKRTARSGHVCDQRNRSSAGQTVHRAERLGVVDHVDVDVLPQRLLDRVVHDVEHRRPARPLPRHSRSVRASRPESPQRKPGSLASACTSSVRTWPRDERPERGVDAVHAPTAAEALEHLAAPGRAPPRAPRPRARPAWPRGRAGGVASFGIEPRRADERARPGSCAGTARPRRRRCRCPRARCRAPAAGGRCANSSRAMAS